MSSHSSQVSAPDIPGYLRRHYRLFTMVIACAAIVVAVEPPSRLDLWTAEWMGTAIFLAIPPLLLMRWLRLHDSPAMLALVVAMAIGLAESKRADVVDETPAARHEGERLPTASDGFGAYARFHD